MKVINDFIVEIKSSHNDEVKLKGTDIVLKVNVKFNQGDYTNRIGTVVGCPVRFESPIKEGYEVLIDKNLVTFQVHSDSLVNKSTYLIDEKKGWYRVPPNMIYLYKKDKYAKWNCPAPFVFIEPIKLNKKQTKGGLIYEALDNYKGFREQYGTIKYINPSLEKQGIKQGDTVYYKKDREYEFKVDEQLLYHMGNSDVLAKVI